MGNYNPNCIDNEVINKTELKNDYPRLYCYLINQCFVFQPNFEKTILKPLSVYVNEMSQIKQSIKSVILACNNYNSLRCSSSVEKRINKTLWFGSHPIYTYFDSIRLYDTIFMKLIKSQSF